MVEFTCYTLAIILDYDDKYGNKGYEYTAFATYNFGIKDMSGKGGSVQDEVIEQGSRPDSIQIGIEPIEYKLSCVWLDSENRTILMSQAKDNIPSAIPTKRIFNFILPGMIVTVTKNGDIPQLLLNTNWIIKSTTINQAVGLYDRMEFDIVISRWYDDIQ